MKRRVKQLLPIKTDKGIIPQSRLEDEDEEAGQNEEENSDDASMGASEDGSGLDNDDSDAEEEEEGEDPDATMADEEAEELAPVQQMALAAAEFNEAKATIANLAQAVIENPEMHVSNLKKLRILLGQKVYKRQPILADYVVVSLCEVYKDILPSYKIRLATDAERQQQAKKETKRLRAYEETLLANYQKYVRLLRAAIKGADAASVSKRRGPKHRRKADASESQYANRAVAVRCLSQLVSSHPYFNESQQLAAALVPCLNDNDAGVSGPVATAFRQLFAEDRAGEASFQLTKALTQFALSRRLRVHSELLQVFTALNIRSDDIRRQQQQQQQQQQQLSHKQRKAKLSRSQRRDKKQNRQLTQNLQELRAQEDASKRARLQQRILEMLMHLYLKVLRQAPSSRLLSSVLDGLCQFGQLVNVELMSELLQSLSRLLSDSSLSPADSLRAVRVAMSLLSGEAESLSLDPREFYQQLYRRLQRLVQQCGRQLALVLVQLLRQMLIERKRQLPAQRPVSFAQQLLLACCRQARAPAPTVAALLCFSAQLLLVFPRAAALLDDEADDGGDGACGSLLPLSDDPDLPRPAAASVVADLRRLASEHRDQTVRRLAGLLLRRRFSELPAPESLLLQSPA